MSRNFPASLKVGKSKKVAGILKIDASTVSWDPQEDTDTKSLSIPLRLIKQLFATPPTKPSNLLKLTCGEPEKDEDVNHMLGFNDRPVLEEVKTLLQTAIKEQREPSASKSEKTTPAPSKKLDNENILDNKHLLENFELQQRILKSDKDLADAFRGAVIDGGLSPEAFWSTRLSLLRPHALLHSQKRGAYNVLGHIKPVTTSDNQINLSVTREQIHDIFEQYPIVQQAYTENVPPLGESSFWQRFFMSRLFRRLRGEKSSVADAPDPIMDKYLNPDGSVKRSKQEEEELMAEEADPDHPNKKARTEITVPHFLDVEGNVENNEKFDVPDITMQAGKSSKDIVSLIRSMNNLSERMLHVRRGVDFHDKDESHLRDELALHDLDVPSTEGNYIDLKLVDELAAAGKSDNPSTKSNANVSPEVFSAIKGSFAQEIDLRTVVDLEQANISDVTIASLVKERAKEETNSCVYSWANTDSENGLMTQVSLCHAASIEFLRQFWSRFLSGDPSQAGTLNTVVTSLKKSLKRMDSVIESASDPVTRSEVEHSLSNLSLAVRTAIEKFNTALEEANALKN